MDIEIYTDMRDIPEYEEDICLDWHTTIEAIDKRFPHIVTTQVGLAFTDYVVPNDYRVKIIDGKGGSEYADRSE